MLRYTVVLIVLLFAVSLKAQFEEEEESIYAFNGDIALPLIRKDEEPMIKDGEVPMIKDGEVPMKKDGEGSVPSMNDGEVSMKNDGEGSVPSMNDGEVPMKKDGEGSVPSMNDGEVPMKKDGEASVPSMMDGEASVPSMMDGEASVPSMMDGEASVPSMQANISAPVSLTAASIKQILDTHNKLRKKEGAANIVKLVWNDKLAEMAQGWADDCSFAHGQPASIVSPFKYTGQNIYAKYPYPSAEIDFSAITMKWFNEKNDYDFENIKCTKVCGHYTQVVWHDTTDLGCGVKQCPTLTGTSWKNAMIVVCNYGPTGNWKGQKPYDKGDKCSACPTSCEDGLCKKAK